MINDMMYNKWNFFINHFHQLAESYMQMSYSVMEDKKDLKGYAIFLKWESKERWDTYQNLIERLMFIGKKPIIEALPKPKNNFANLTEILNHAVELEKMTVNAINAAISETTQNQDYFSEIEFKKLFCEELGQYNEVEKVVTRTLALNGYNDMAVLMEIDEELYEMFNEKFGYK